MVIYFFFVETRGASLEEASLVIDGKEKQEQLIEGAIRTMQKDSINATVVTVNNGIGEKSD